MAAPETTDRRAPEYHTWIDSRLPWFDIDDDLPRYADDGPGVSTD